MSKLYDESYVVKLTTETMEQKETLAALRSQLATVTAEREAMREALVYLQHAVNKHGVCVCGHDGKLTSQDCPIHGYGALQAARALKGGKG